MFRTSIRRFATSATRAADLAVQYDAKNAYGIGISKAQGVAHGLTGGTDIEILYATVMLKLMFVQQLEIPH